MAWRRSWGEPTPTAGARAPVPGRSPRRRRARGALAALAARVIPWSGALLVLFLVVHLLQLRWDRPPAAAELAALRAVLAAPACCPLRRGRCGGGPASAAWRRERPRSLGCSIPPTAAVPPHGRSVAGPAAGGRLHAAAACAGAADPGPLGGGRMSGHLPCDLRLDPRLPAGPIATAWERTLLDLPRISPANKRGLRVLVVGSGLAGASAAATLAEQGYGVEVVTYHDSPRRAHSVAAQGGINAAKQLCQRWRQRRSGCSATR